MELISVFDPLEPNLLPTFSYIDMSSMILKGPFCSNCMNLEKWKLSQLSDTGKLLLYQHLVGENVGRELWDLQLRNGSARPFSFWKPMEGFLPLPCSEMTCRGNKAIDWYHKQQNYSEVLENQNKTISSVESMDLVSNPCCTSFSDKTSPQKTETEPEKPDRAELCSLANKELSLKMKEPSSPDQNQMNEMKLAKLISDLKSITQDTQQPQKTKQIQLNKHDTTELINKVEEPLSVEEPQVIYQTPIEITNGLEVTAQDGKIGEILKTTPVQTSAPADFNSGVPQPLNTYANPRKSSSKTASSRLPFFHPSVAVKKPLDINRDLHRKFDQISNDKEFSKFVKLLGSKYASFSKSVTNTRPFVRCDTCDKSFNTWNSLVTHTFCRTHIVQMYNFGHLFDATDLEVIWNIYQEACVLITDEKQTKTDKPATICTEAPKETRVIPSQSTMSVKMTGSLDTAACKSRSMVHTNIGKKENSSVLETTWKNVVKSGRISTVTSSIVLNTDRLDLPFSMGSANISVAYPEKELPTLLNSYKKRLAVLSADVIEMVLESNYRLPENSKCWTCKSVLAPSEWISHLISKTHVEKLGKCGQMARMITHWDVKRMNQLLQDCDKKAAEFPSLKIVPSTKDRSKRSASVKKIIGPKKSDSKSDETFLNSLSASVKRATFGLSIVPKSQATGENSGAKAPTPSPPTKSSRQRKKNSV